MKRRATLQVIKKMQMKTTMRRYHDFNRTAKMKKTISTVDKNEEQVDYIVPQRTEDGKTGAQVSQQQSWLLP